MKTFDVQTVEIGSPFARAFEYIADPSMLPEWTHAFASVKGRRAVMRTPAGAADVDLEVTSSRDGGVIDWKMTFPDGQIAKAWSRLVPHGDGRVIYSFVLSAPPVPLEQLEGTLAEQSKVLASELAALARLLERP
jgi:hypothetical protein